MRLIEIRVVPEYRTSAILEVSMHNAYSEFTFERLLFRSENKEIGANTGKQRLNISIQYRDEAAIDSLSCDRCCIHPIKINHTGSSTMGHITEPTFPALVNELIINIAGFLELRDLLSLRQTSYKMEENSSRAIKERKFTLYLHPLRIQDAINTCNVSTFRNSISEVVLLGKSTRTLRPHNFSEEFDNFHPWPLSEDMSDLARFHVDDPSAYTKEHHAKKWMPACYAGLFDAFSRLPHLNTIGYSSQALGSLALLDGLCSSSQGVIDAYGREPDPWHPWTFDADDDTYSRPADDFLGFWTDSELFMGILAARCASFTTINLCQSLPDKPGLRWTRLHDRWLPKVSGPVSKMAHDSDTFSNSHVDLHALNDDDYREATVGMGLGVTRLAVVLPDGDTSRGASYNSIGIFQEFVARLPDLEVLDVTIDSGVDEHHRMLVSGSGDKALLSRYEGVQLSTYCIFVFDLAPSDCLLRHLQRVRFTCPSVLPNCHDSYNACLFLRAHSSTLREVSFSNIFFADLDGPDDQRVGIGMRDVIQAFGEITGLNQAQLYVPRVESMHESDMRAGVIRGDSAKCYRSADGNLRSKWLGVDVFDQLAADMGVPLEGAGWDFVKQIIPPKAIEASKED